MNTLRSALPTLLVLAATVAHAQPPTTPAKPATPATPTQPDAPATPPPVQALAPVPRAPIPPATVRNVPYGTFKAELPMIQRNVIVGVRGRMGGMAMDIQANVLFAAATASNAIVVHNVADSKSLQYLSDQPGPTALVFLQASRLLVASCATDSTCRVFKVNDSSQIGLERTINFSGETGPLVADPASGLCWVGHGVFVSGFNPADGSKKAEVSLEGIGRPVDFAAERSTPRLFTITTPASDVVVIDRDKAGAQGAVAARWKLSERTPTALALDEANRRLFVATKNPAKLIVLDSADGREVAKFDASEEPGSLSYDPFARKVYLAANSGHVRVYAQITPDVYQVLTTDITAPGSRTSLLVPEHRRLIVVAPNLGDEEASRLFIYQIGP